MIPDPTIDSIGPKGTQESELAFITISDVILRTTLGALECKILQDKYSALSYLSWTFGPQLLPCET